MWKRCVGRGERGGMGFLLLSLAASLSHLLKSLSQLSSISVDRLPLLHLHTSGELELETLNTHPVHQCVTSDWVLLYEDSAGSPPCESSTTLSDYSASSVDVLLAVDKAEWTVHFLPGPDASVLPRLLCIDKRGLLFIGGIEHVIAVDVPGGLVCEAVVEVHAPMTLDLALMADWESMNGINAESLLSSHFEQDDNWIELCASMHASLSGEGERLTVTNGHLRNDVHSLAYWLNFCGEENNTVVVQQRDHHVQWNLHHAVNTRRYSSDDNQCLVERVHDPARRFPTMPATSFDLKTMMDNHDGHCDILTFLCMEDVLKLLLSEDRVIDDMSPRSVTYFSPFGLESLTSSSGSTSPNVSSTYHSFQNIIGVIKAFQAVSMETNKRDLVLHVKSFWSSFAKLRFSINNSNTADYAQHSHMLNIARSEVENVEYNIEDEVTGGFQHSAPSAASRSKIPLTSNPSSILNLFPIVDGARQVHIQELSVGVLIFTGSSAERAQAEALLADWNGRCPLCNLCVSYMILQQDDGVHFRTMLLSTLEWVEAKSVNLDWVVVLRGVDAMAAFKTPGTPGGLIPIISLENPAYYSIPHNVIFSSKQITALEPSCEEKIDSRAFAGFAFEIRTLILSALSNPNGKFSDLKLHEYFLNTVCSSDLLFHASAIDAEHRIFNQVQTSDDVSDEIVCHYSKQSYFKRLTKILGLKVNPSNPLFNHTLLDSNSKAMMGLRYLSLEVSGHAMIQ